jgi:hypothetical protein
MSNVSQSQTSSQTSFSVFKMQQKSYSLPKWYNTIQRFKQMPFALAQNVESYCIV